MARKKKHILTIQELIDQLQKVKDKTKHAYVYPYDYPRALYITRVKTEPEDPGDDEDDEVYLETDE